jgi:Exopolyphosphatase-related proteins
MRIYSIDLIVKEIVKPENKNVVVITHIRPDGDTLGSAYGLKYAVEDNFPDKKVTVLCGEEIKDRLQFIFGEDAPLLTLDELDHDLVIAVDSAEPVLMGENAKFAEAGKINIKIDHHVNGSCYADINYIDDKASSCGEIIFDICKKLGEITEKVALPLYAAICSDTGNFRFRNVTAITHRITAELIDTGIDQADISRKLYGMKTQKELISQRLALNNLRYYNNGSIAVTMITNEMKLQNSITDDDLGDINSITLDIEGVDLGITIKQFDDKPDKFRVSMRSSENVDASVICNKLGGGGHVRASGALVKADDPISAERKIVETAMSVIGEIE